MNYQRIYDSIISKAKSENRAKSKDTYYEAHHIIPVCLGGEGSSSQWKTHSNIILLTAREHFLCHWLLHEIYPDNKELVFAFWMMCNVNPQKEKLRHIPSSRIFEYVRIEKNKKMSAIFKDVKLTENHIEKLRISHLGQCRPCSEETRQKISNAKKGKSNGREGHIYSQKTKNLMSISAKNRATKTCPHCNKPGVNNMTRWHFDNCKHKHAKNYFFN